jgi:hypothetical protein
LKAWEAEGYGYDDVEVWAIGGPGELMFLSNFMAGSDSSAFEDTDGSAAAAFGARTFSTVVLDRHNVKQSTFFSSDVDTLVRSLLASP